MTQCDLTRRHNKCPQQCLKQHYFLVTLARKQSLQVWASDKMGWYFRVEVRQGARCGSRTKGERGMKCALTISSYLIWKTPASYPNVKEMWPNRSRGCNRNQCEQFKWIKQHVEALRGAATGTCQNGSQTQCIPPGMHKERLTNLSPPPPQLSFCLDIAFEGVWTISNSFSEQASVGRIHKALALWRQVRIYMKHNPLYGVEMKWELIKWPACSFTLCHTVPLFTRARPI